MSSKDNKDADFGLYIALGMCFGTAIGTAFNQLAYGISFGLLAGVIFYNIKSSKKKR